MIGIAEFVTKWYKLFIILVLLLSLFHGVFHNLCETPKLTYEILDSYSISKGDQLIPIVVRNEGYGKATNIRITIHTDGDIESVKAKTSEKYTPYLENDNTTQIVELPRLLGNSQIVFNLRIKSFTQKPIDQILIVSDQVYGGIHEVPILKIYFIFLIVIMIAVCLGFIFGYISRFYSFHQKRYMKIKKTNINENT